MDKASDTIKKGAQWASDKISSVTGSSKDDKSSSKDTNKEKDTYNKSN